MLCYKCSKKIQVKDKVLHGLHELCFMEWFDLRNIHDFQDVSRKSVSSFSAGTEAMQLDNSSFFRGKFRKYSAVLNNQSYLLKMEEAEYPELPKTEYLCNQLALSLGLNVPVFYLLKFNNQVDAFVSRIFTQDYGSCNLVHIYRYFTKAMPFNCANIIAVIREQTQKITEIERFVHLCLFDSLIGNHDRHGRNLAFLQTPAHLELTPFYDNVSYLGIEIAGLLSAQHDPKGRISTTIGAEPGIADYVVEFKKMGFAIIVEDFFARIQLANVLAIVSASFLTQARKDALVKLITKRYEDLCHAISR